MLFRKLNVLFLGVVLGMVSCQTKSPAYTLVWEDSFDGDSINTAYWNLEDNARGGGNAEMQYYTPRNASIEEYPGTGERCLVLSAKRGDYRNRPATSARLNTQDKVTVKYGKIEARIAFPYTANGIWPAFWMLGNDLATDLGNNDDVDAKAEQLAREGRCVWPRCGEIDIVEMGHKTGMTREFRTVISMVLPIGERRSTTANTPTKQVSAKHHTPCRAVSTSSPSSGQRIVWRCISTGTYTPMSHHISPCRSVTKKSTNRGIISINRSTSC